MAKRLSREQKNEQAVKDLINQMFIIAGHQVTYEDVVGRKDAWYAEWTMTVAQSDEWKKWMTEYFKKECKYFSKIASREAEMCALMWGLKFSDYGE